MFSPLAQTDYRYRDPGSPVSAEPMTLGSPVSSPKNKTSAQSYLPSYLFGEVVSSPIGCSGWNSPTGTPKQSSFSSFQSQSPLINSVRFRDQDTGFQSGSPSSIITTPNTAKSGGPPVQGLIYSTSNQFTTFNTSQIENLSSTTDGLVSESQNISGFLSSSNPFKTPNASYLSPAQIDPFYTQGEALKTSDQLDESWVTVFGFPSASATYILQQFSQYGNIVEHKISPNGNWMHVKYQSKLQAKKALSKNGKVFSGNIMIGVKPCIELELMISYKDSSVVEKSSLTDSLPNENAENTKPNLKNMRPLTQAYQSPNTQAQTTPKSGSIVSKALEYIWKK